MRNKKDVVLIPYWIHEILQRNNLPLATCLDVAKIKPLMSFNDLACFFAMQNQVQLIMGLDYNFVNVLTNATNNTELDKFIFNTLLPLSNDESIKNELKNRLFYSESKNYSYTEPFKTHDLSPTVCGVVIYPGYFTDTNKYELQKAVIESLLKVFYVYGTFSEVASSDFFKKYLELLAIN